MIRRLWPLLLLAACSGRHDRRAHDAAPPSDLESAAIEAGVIRDPAGTDITGLYARETDRVCIVPAASGWRVGVFVDYGDQQSCGGSGTITRVGETLHLSFPAADGCAFDARFDGDRIVFPGRVPDGCARLCSRRASIAGLDVDQLSDSVSEASTLRDGRGRLLCASDGD